MGKEREINGTSCKNSKASYYVIACRVTCKPSNMHPQSTQLCVQRLKELILPVTQKYSLLQPKERAKKKKPKEEKTPLMPLPSQ